MCPQLQAPDHQPVGKEILRGKKSKLDVSFKSWLKHHISDSVVNMEGYNLVRKDRQSRDPGGLGIYMTVPTR